MTRFFRDPQTSEAASRARRVSAAIGTDIGTFDYSRGARRRGMFANPSRATYLAHSPEELLREQQACADPVFQGVLGNPRVERNIGDAMATAIATPNHGTEGDIPANGSEQGFLARKFPVIGTLMGPAIPNYREGEMEFDLGFAPFPNVRGKPQDLIGIHTHQSPRGAPGLSNKDIAATKPSPVSGPGINIVAIDKDGRRYCKVAQR